MKIHKVTYVEGGYFEVKYNTITIVQDVGAIKMTVPTDTAIKNILMFLRSLKLEKLQEDEFDDLKYRDHVVYTKTVSHTDVNDMMDAFGV